MGVSRSASFVLAYLILYGESLAKLEDAQPLFANTFKSERAAVRRAEEITRRYSRNNHSADLATTTEAVAAQHGTQAKPLSSHTIRSSTIPKCSPLRVSYTNCGSPLTGDSGSDLLTPRETAAATCWPCFRMRRNQFQQYMTNGNASPLATAQAEGTSWTTTSTWCTAGIQSPLFTTRHQQTPANTNIAGKKNPRANADAPDGALIDVVTIQSPLSTNDAAQNAGKQKPRKGTGSSTSGNDTNNGDATVGYTTATPGMGYREAFQFLKDRKPDVNPNIGFVLALRELAGGGDFRRARSL